MTLLTSAKLFSRYVSNSSLNCLKESRLCCFNIMTWWREFLLHRSIVVNQLLSFHCVESPSPRYNHIFQNKPLFISEPQYPDLLEGAQNSSKRTCFTAIISTQNQNQKLFRIAGVFYCIWCFIPVFPRYRWLQNLSTNNRPYKAEQFSTLLARYDFLTSCCISSLI